MIVEDAISKVKKTLPTVKKLKLLSTDLLYRIFKFGIVTALIHFTFIFVSYSPSYAQEPTPMPTPPPVERQIGVSAIMPDVIPPSTPILIAPENNELINTNRPQFVWQASTDNVGVSHYQLIIDGQLVINNITQIGSFERYTLSYNSHLDHYYLEIKFDLNQGQHTWKITAVDGAGLTTDSVTWSFMVDSIPPHFVLTKIGDVETAISARDLTTLPQKPIVLTVNQPTLIASGEPHSTVQLTVIIPNQDNFFAQSTINSQGWWQFTLPILPRDKIITLNFVIIDLARHISVLENIQIIIPSEVITIPKTATPTTIKTTPGETPYPPLSPSAAPDKPIPPIEIPYKPPKEIVYELIRWLTPTPIWRTTTKSWFQNWLHFFGPWLVLLAVGWPSIVATLLLSRKFGLLISGKHLIKIWQALGIIPYEDREGWVFNSKFTQWLENKTTPTYFNQEMRQELLNAEIFVPGVSFAHLTAISQPSENGFPAFYQTVLTDQDGLYLPLKLPLNKYRISVQAEDFRYPTLQTKPENVDLVDFYKAQELEVNINKASLSLQIPVDPVRQEQIAVDTKNQKYTHNWLFHSSWMSKCLLWLAKIIKFNNLIVLGNILIAIVLILFWPSTVNIICLGMYLIFGLYYLFKDNLFGNIRGVVIDKNGNLAQNVLIRLINKDGSNQIFATLTNQKGQFCFYFKHGNFAISTHRAGQNSIQKHNPDFEELLTVNGWWDQKRVALVA